MQLIKVPSVKDFQLTSLVPIDEPRTARNQALRELGECVNALWPRMPTVVQDFLLRSARSFGASIDYPALPFWAERPARHVFSILYPTLKNSDFNHPTTEDLGRVCGHMLAFTLHAKDGTAIFKRLDAATAELIKTLFHRVELPLQVLINDGLNLPPHEAGKFLKGLNHAFSRTFDAVGLPCGWNTNSPVLLGICLMWRFIATQSPSLPELHRALAKAIGEQIVGSEDRVKKICHRVGLRFSGNRAVDREGTAVILDVPSATKKISDK